MSLNTNYQINIYMTREELNKRFPHLICLTDEEVFALGFSCFMNLLENDMTSAIGEYLKHTALEKQKKVKKDHPK